VHRLYGVLPWGIIALGVLHMAATWRYFDQLTQQALWFFNGGLVMVFAAVLNLVNRAHGVRATSLRIFTRVTNILLLGFALLAGLVGRAKPLELVVIVGVLGAIAVLSMTRKALNPSEGRV
jgi:hypothetical protein